TRTKHGANRLAEKLVKDGIEAAAIHSNKSQGARTKALAQFKDGSMRVLVATDIAARGLDIDQLPQVVNFELPNVPEDYVHRIGRTGRAGSTGAAVSLVDHEEVKLLKGIERLIKREIPRVAAEGFVAPTKVEAEAPRPPRPQQQRRPQGQANKAGARQNNGSDKRQDRTTNHGQRDANSQRKPNGQARTEGQRNHQPQRQNQGQSQSSSPSANQTKSASGKPMSEAARHQAMPQAALFSPKPIHRGGNRGR
ncbi:MAG: helicase-related protein, partial [Methylophilaceae bacterium]|nr:helicase-related protein [Methylophilaceae bacterium]